MLKCNKCQGNVKDNCLYLSVESCWGSLILQWLRKSGDVIINIWVNFRWAGIIFKFYIKKLVKDGENDYAMRIVSNNIIYEFSISWLMCGFLVVLATNGIKMQVRWFILTFGWIEHGLALCPSFKLKRLSMMVEMTIL